jgi:prophage regulatory protein
MVAKISDKSDSPRPQRLIPIGEVVSRTSLGRSTVYREISAGRFPKPIPASAGRMAWIEAEVDEWIESTISKARN